MLINIHAIEESNEIFENLLIYIEFYLHLILLFKLWMRSSYI